MAMRLIRLRGLSDRWKPVGAEQGEPAMLQGGCALAKGPKRLKIEKQDSSLPLWVVRLLRTLSAITVGLVAERVAHNWNVGILELWNNGFWGNGVVICWQYFIELKVIEVHEWDTSF
jgi:hypothetical protein